MNGFGEWLRKVLTSVGRSDSWLCRKSGLSHTTVTRYRILGQQPRVDAFVTICEVLSKETGEHIDDVILTAVRSTPAYKSAISRCNS
jgi:hypothetical protein|tara:strand:+ start:830 stop:1090 length:261 start_codon:yes stop_codon:yes gene_type:complete